jgi:hypothetical protein
MHRPDLAAAWSLCAALAVATPACADEAAFRYRAPITVTTPAAFVQLPLPASAYGRSLQPGLQDLMVVDAKNERVPFAILAARAAEVRSTEQQRDATLYPLPAKPAASGAWDSPIEIAVQGDRISVKRRGDTAATSASARSGGWLIDMGERKRDEPAPKSLRMQWSAPQEFSATYRIETSDDLQKWRAGGAGQLLAFNAPTGALTQPAVTLPANAGRFARLVWADAAVAPVISGAKVIAATESSVAIDPPTELVFATSPAPASKDADEAAQRALHYDLGGNLPLVQVDLRMPSGTRVAPVRLQGRTGDSEAWRELGSTVFYRLERSGEVSQSPPYTLRTVVRYLRVLPDARAAAIDPGQTQLVVQAELAGVVFATEGAAPYTLLAGAEKATLTALPVATLVPALDDERPRFGRAMLGEWVEVAEVARAADQRKQMAALRPWLLWAVLLAGVAGLAFMVWRLTRPTVARVDAGP